jgi:hypothetical protein
MAYSYKMPSAVATSSNTCKAWQRRGEGQGHALSWQGARGLQGVAGEHLAGVSARPRSPMGTGAARLAPASQQGASRRGSRAATQHRRPATHPAAAAA